MHRLLVAAARQGRIISNGPLDFWVTEFGWDSDPPDRGGVPTRLHARWVSEALYRMWKAKVTLASWFLLRDGTGDDTRFQSGLYALCPQNALDVRCDRPKRSLRAFRFPFVAFRERRQHESDLGPDAEWRARQGGGRAQRRGAGGAAWRRSRPTRTGSSSAACATTGTAACARGSPAVGRARCPFSLRAAA